MNIVGTLYNSITGLLKSGEDALHASSEAYQTGQGIIAHEREMRGAAVVLLLGRSGSGKTFLIKTTCAAQGQNVDGASIQGTQSVSSRYLSTLDKEFKLIDTPGFDNAAMSDLEAIGRLADYLIDGHRIRVPISGIVYIHRTGDSSSGRTLMQNLGVLSEVILGDSGLSRLVILAVPEPYAKRTITAKELSLAPIFRAVLDRGAQIKDARLNRERMDKVWDSFTSREPVLLRVQQEGFRNSRHAIWNQIEQQLAYYEPSLLKSHVDQELKKHLAHHAEQINSLESRLREKDSKLEEYDKYARGLKLAYEAEKAKTSEFSQACKRFKHQLVGSQEDTRALQQQLQQTQTEYGSLRSQVQLQDNTEQSEIVQKLKDLNQDIDEICSLLSAYLVDNYVQSLFGKHPNEVTTLDSHDISSLKEAVGHIDDKSSLVMSSSGVGMAIEDFLDHMIRALLCDYLCRIIFNPFHPAIDFSASEVLAKTYNTVRRREPQAVAAKWRSESFKSIYETGIPGVTAGYVNSIANDFGNAALCPLLTLCFGPEAHITLEEQHQERIGHLFRAAWDWNSMLKADVLVLGDFHPTCYPSLHKFDPSCMSEFEPNARKPRSNYIMGTLGLGLISSYAVGGGKDPETTTVLKAIVATESLYA